MKMAREYECAREQDVLDTLAAQRWPAQADADLRTHVAACAICTDLIDIASALLEDHESVSVDARVPPSGIVWWTAQVRAREEAARAAARPIAFVQGIAASCAVWLAVSVLRALPLRMPAAPDWRGWLADVSATVQVSLPDTVTLASIPSGVGLLLLVLGAWLVFAPLAIYFAASGD